MNNQYMNIMDKLNQVCNKFSIKSLELDEKLSKGLLKYYSEFEIKNDHSIINKILDRLLEKK